MACRTARLATVVQTPASAAMWPKARVQLLRFPTSNAITASTACSPRVKPAASAGGRYPPAAMRRRRARLRSSAGRSAGSAAKPEAGPRPASVRSRAKT